MNNKSFESPLAHFHNQKDGSFDEENGGERSIMHDRKYLEWVRDEERRNKIKEMGKSADLRKMIADTVFSINQAELENLFQDDLEQQSELEKAKANARKMLLETLAYVDRYLETVKKSDHLKQREEELGQKNYLVERKEVENIRTAAHNALISQIQATIRFIAHTFGDISTVAIERWEKEREVKGLPVLGVKRVKLRKNVFLPDNINIRDRDHIASWADLISVALTELREEIKTDSVSRRDKES